MKVSAMERNTDLFHAIARKIEDEPERYNQTSYGDAKDATACGSSHCIAGWAVVIAAPQRAHWQYLGCTEDHWILLPTSSELEFGWSMNSIGAELLGLEDDEACMLFSAAWEPLDGLTPWDALVKIGNGAAVQEVSQTW